MLEIITGFFKNKIVYHKTIVFYSLFLLLFFANFSGCKKPSDPVYTEPEKDKISDHAAFTSFVIEKRYHPGLTYDVRASINNSTRQIFATIRQKMAVDLKQLRPTFSFEGAYIMKGKEVVESTVLVDNYTHPVKYRLFAEDGSFYDYTVSIEFASTYQYKPEASGLAIKGQLFAGRTLTPEFSFIDRNGNRPKKTIIVWQVETAKYSGEYSDKKTYYYSDPDVAEGVDITDLNDAAYTLPAGYAGRRVRLLVTPVAEFNPDPELQFNEADTIGYEVQQVAAYTIKPDIPMSGIMINEIRTKDTNSGSESGGTSTLSEFIRLYNMSDETIDIAGLKVQVHSGGSWVDYFTVEADPDTPDLYVKPAEHQVVTEVEKDGSFLIATSMSPIRIKLAADIVLNKEIHSRRRFMEVDGGAVRILNSDGDVLDCVGYGTENTAPQYEGPSSVEGDTLLYAPAPLPLASIVRSRNKDTDNNGADFVPRMPILPRGSGKNILELKDYPPRIANVQITEVPADPNNAAAKDLSFEVEYDYIEWQYSSEKPVNIKWELFTEIYNNATEEYEIFELRKCLDPENCPGDGSCYGETGDTKIICVKPLEGEKFPEDDGDWTRFSFSVNDFRSLPDLVDASIKVTVEPRIDDAELLQQIYEDDNDITDIAQLGSECILEEDGEFKTLVPDVPAQLRLVRVYPDKNIVEFTTRKSGNLTDLYLAVTHIEPFTRLTQDDLFESPFGDDVWNYKSVEDTELGEEEVRRVYLEYLNRMVPITKIAALKITGANNNVKPGDTRYYATQPIDSMPLEWTTDEKFSYAPPVDETESVTPLYEGAGGVVVELYELLDQGAGADPDDEDCDPSYVPRDLFAYSLGFPSEESHLLKKHIFLSNKVSRNSEYKNRVWDIQNDDFDDALWEEFYKQPFNDEAGSPEEAFTYICTESDLAYEADPADEMDKDRDATCFGEYCCTTEGQTITFSEAIPAYSTIKETLVANDNFFILDLPAAEANKNYPLYREPQPVTFENDVPWYHLDFADESDVPEYLWTSYRGFFSLDIENMSIIPLGIIEYVYNGVYYKYIPEEDFSVPVPVLDAECLPTEYWLVLDDTGLRFVDNSITNGIRLYMVNLECVDSEGVLETVITDFRDNTTTYFTEDDPDNGLYKEGLPTVPAVYIERQTEPVQGMVSSKDDYRERPIVDENDAPWILNEDGLSWERED